MAMSPRARVTIGLAVLAVACGAGPRPGDPGYAYNVSGVYAGRLFVGNDWFDARLELRTAPGGRVQGVFRVGAPFRIDGRVTGAVMDDLLRLTVPYAGTAARACDGRIEGILTVERGGGVIDGPVTITDCEGALAGRMSFRR